MLTTKDIVIAACTKAVLEYSTKQAAASPLPATFFRDIAEIDLCARIASFFSPQADLAAQGSSKPDVISTNPSLQIEVKYFSGSYSLSWNAPSSKKKPIDDWMWLTDNTLTPAVAQSRAFVIFWPPTAGSGLHNYLSFLPSVAPNYTVAELEPFRSYLVTNAPKIGAKYQWLSFSPMPTNSVYALANGVTVSTNVIGNHASELWCVVYTRVT